jgi:hypothetical protein
VMKKKVVKVSIPEYDLEVTVEKHMDDGYKFLGFTYSGKFIIDAGEAVGTPEIIVLFCQRD